ncbi:MAG: hypothetical protein AB1567_07105 [bacterium]
MLNFVFYLISSYGIIILGVVNLLIHINYFELIKSKGIGLLIVSFLPAISILVLGVGQTLNIAFRTKFNIQGLVAVVVIALSLTGIITTTILAKSWALKHYILWISLFILGLNRLVFAMINRLPQWMIIGAGIILLNGLFYCISGPIFLLTGLPLVILGANDLKIINIRTTLDALTQWIFFTFLLLIALFILNFGIEGSNIETILFGIGIIPISILFFFLARSTKKKTKGKLTFKLILPIISFILIGLSAYATLLGAIVAQIYYEVVQGIEKWEMIGSTAITICILGSISLLLGAMIGIKTYKSSFGVFIFGLLVIVYIYLTIINLDALFLLALPLFICLLSIFVIVKKHGIDRLKLRGNYPLIFILTSFAGIFIITLIIQYNKFKTMDTVIGNIINKISTQGPNISRIAKGEEILKRSKRLSQHLLFKPYAGKLKQKTNKLERYVNKYILEVKKGKYPGFYIESVHDKKFTHEQIRRLKNLLDKFTLEYEWQAKSNNKKVALIIHGVTNTLTNDIKELFGDSYTTPLGYYPELKEGRYPEQVDEVIINSLSDYFDKSKKSYHFYLKKDDLILLSCTDEKVGKEIVLLGKRYKIVGISDKLTNYRDIYLPYFEAKRLTEQINLTDYEITEQDGIFTILNTIQQVDKVKSTLKEMDFPCFEGVID